jgi:hypothetical protein
MCGSAGVAGPPLQVGSTRIDFLPALKREAFSSHFRKPVFAQPEHVIESDGERRERLRAEPQGNRASLGRLLVVLGAPQGRKTAQQFGLLCYLDPAPESVRRRFAEVYLLNRVGPMTGMHSSSKRTARIRTSKRLRYCSDR